MQLGQRLCHGQTDTCTCGRSLGGGVEAEEGLEYLLAHIMRNNVAIVLHHQRKLLVVGAEQHHDVRGAIFYSVVHQVAHNLGEGLMIDIGMQVAVLYRY